MLGEDRGEPGQPPGVEQADVDQVAEVGAVLVANGGQLDPHERLEPEHLEGAGVLGVADVGIGQGLVRADLLVGEDDVHRVAGSGAESTG